MTRSLKNFARWFNPLSIVPAALVVAALALACLVPVQNVQAASPPSSGDGPLQVLLQLCAKSGDAICGDILAAQPLIQSCFGSGANDVQCALAIANLASGGQLSQSEGYVDAIVSCAQQGLPVQGDCLTALQAAGVPQDKIDDANSIPAIIDACHKLVSAGNAGAAIDGLITCAHEVLDSPVVSDSGFTIPSWVESVFDIYDAIKKPDYWKLVYEFGVTVVCGVANLLSGIDICGLLEDIAAIGKEAYAVGAAVVDFFKDLFGAIAGAIGDITGRPKTMPQDQYFSMFWQPAINPLAQAMRADPNQWSVVASQLWNNCLDYHNSHDTSSDHATEICNDMRDGTATRDDHMVNKGFSQKVMRQFGLIVLQEAVDASSANRYATATKATQAESAYDSRWLSYVDKGAAYDEVRLQIVPWYAKGNTLGTDPSSWPPNTVGIAAMVETLKTVPAPGDASTPVARKKNTTAVATVEQAMGLDQKLTQMISKAIATANKNAETKLRAYLDGVRAGEEKFLASQSCTQSGNVWTCGKWPTYDACKDYKLPTQCQAAADICKESKLPLGCAVDTKKADDDLLQTALNNANGTVASKKCDLNGYVVQCYRQHAFDSCTSTVKNAVRDQATKVSCRLLPDPVYNKLVADAAAFVKAVNGGDSHVFSVSGGSTSSTLTPQKQSTATLATSGNPIRTPADALQQLCAGQKLCVAISDYDPLIINHLVPANQIGAMQQLPANVVAYYEPGKAMGARCSDVTDSANEAPQLCFNKPITGSLSVPNARDAAPDTKNIVAPAALVDRGGTAGARDLLKNAGGGGVDLTKYGNGPAPGGPAPSGGGTPSGTFIDKTTGKAISVSGVQTQQQGTLKMEVAGPSTSALAIKDLAGAQGAALAGPLGAQGSALAGAQSGSTSVAYMKKTELPDFTTGMKVGDKALFQQGCQMSDPLARKFTCSAAAAPICQAQAAAHPDFRMSCAVAGGAPAVTLPSAAAAPVLAAPRVAAPLAAAPVAAAPVTINPAIIAGMSALESQSFQQSCAADARDPHQFACLGKPALDACTAQSKRHPELKLICAARR